MSRLRRRASVLRFLALAALLAMLAPVAVGDVVRPAGILPWTTTGAGVALHDGSILVLGGFGCDDAGCPQGGCSGAPCGPLDGIARYDPLTRRSTALDARLPEPLANVAVAQDAEAIYVFGGSRADFSRSNAIWRASPDALTFALATTLPAPRDGMAAVWTGTDFLLFGGTSCFPRSLFCDEILRYDPVAGEVTTLAFTLPQPIAYAKAFWDGASAYVVGGSQCGTSPCRGVDTIVRVTPSTGEVTTLEARLASPGQVAGAWAGRKLMLLGGGGCEPTTVAGVATGFFSCAGTTTVQEFDPVTLSLRTLDVVLPADRYGATAAWASGRIVLIGGNSEQGVQRTVYAQLALPSPPTPATASLQLDGTILVGWTIPDRGIAPEVEAYDVYRVPADGAVTLVARVAASATSFVDSAPTTLASYRVVALNAHGSSTPATTEMVASWHQAAAIP